MNRGSHGAWGLALGAWFVLTTLSHAATIPTPASVLGFEPGTRAAHHQELRQYAEALADSTDRVQLHMYGQTHEGRELLERFGLV